MSLEQRSRAPRTAHRPRRVCGSPRAGGIARFAGSVLAWLALSGAVAVLGLAVPCDRGGGA